jgi:hypothetical protein
VSGLARQRHVVSATLPPRPVRSITRSG